MFNVPSASTYLQSLCREVHLHKSCILTYAILCQYLLDACSSFRILCYHIQIAATACSWQFISQTEVVNHTGQFSHIFRIGTRIEQLILRPRLAHQLSHTHKVVLLDSLIHVECMLLHLSQQAQLAAMIQEHSANYLGQYALSRTRYACII